MTPAQVRYETAGDWFCVAGRSFAAIVGPSAPSSILDTLWWLAESELAELESVVGAFPLTGDRAVASFAVVGFGSDSGDGADTHVTAVVRGDACVDVFSVGGARRLSAGGVEPWLLAGFRSVTGFALCGAGREPAAAATVSSAALPLRRGIVRGGSLVWSLASIPREAPGGGGAADLFAPGAGPDASGEGISGPDRGSDDTPDPGTGAESAPEHVTDPREAVETNRERRPVSAAEPDDDTLILARRPLPPMPGAHEPGPGEDESPAASAFTLRIGVEETILLDQPTIIGRNPRSPGMPYGQRARLVTVASPELEVSGSHLQIQQVGESVVVTDLRSTNGTFILYGDRSPERLRPGESRVVAPGAALDIGDGNIIEIAHNP